MGRSEPLAEACTLLLEGVVTSGLGEGKGFTELPWVRREFLSKLGFEPYPGTFNLRLVGTAWADARAMLAKQPGIDIAAEPGFCAAKCFHVVVGGRITGAVVFPQIADYPFEKFEVISAVPMRETLPAQDGDCVQVSVLC